MAWILLLIFCGASTGGKGFSNSDINVKKLWRRAVVSAHAKAAMPKQVLVLRTRYPDGKGGVRKIRTGKLVAQAAHASMKVFFDRMKPMLEDGRTMDRQTDACPLSYYRLTATQEMAQWKDGIFTKVVVGVETEEELLALKEKADMAGIVTALVYDKGLTEFKHVETATCLAIGPDMPDLIDPITGSLELL